MSPDVQIIYDIYSNTYSNPYSEEEFERLIQEDPTFVNGVFTRAANTSQEGLDAVNRLLNNSNISTGQEGNLDYETNEEVEAKKKRQEEIDNFVPVTKNGEIDFEHYEGLAPMEREKVLFDEWLKQHPEANPSASDVNNYPSVTNQVGVELNYDPSEYIGVQIENVLKEEEEYREQKLKEDAEIYEAEEVEAPVVEQVFTEELFTPYDAAQTGSLLLQDDIGAEGFKLAFEDEMPDNIQFYTFESLRDENTPYYSEAPAEAKRMRKNNQQNFLFVQVTDKNGNKQIHQVKSFAEDEEDRQDPTKAQKQFINFISPHLNETALQKLQKKDKEISQKVSELFQSALNLTEKDFSFAPDATPEEKQNIINSANSKVKAGVLGISFEDRQKIKQEVDNIDFGVTKSTSGARDAFGQTTGSVIFRQPHEEVLKEALAEIKYQDVKNRVDRRNNPLTSTDSNGFTVYSDEVKDLARQKIAAKKENKLREDKIEAYLQGDVEGALPANLIRKYQVRGKKDAEFKAAKAEYLNTVARNDMINAQTNNFRNAKLLIDFVNDPSAKYNIKPGEKVVTLEDGRLVPLALFNNALKENQNFLDKKFVYDSTLNSFEKELSKMTDAEEQWDLLRRNYNDGAKFASQLGIATADLILNVAYGVKKLGDIVLPTSIAARYMMDNLGIEDPIDNAMNVWNNYKEETSSKFKKDQAFGEIETLADVGEYALQSIAQQTPIIVSMIATGGLSGVAGKAAGLTGKALTRLSTISSSSMIGLSSFGGKVSEMNYEEFVTGKNLYSDTETLVKGLMYGVVEGGLAAISTAPLISKGIGKASGLNLSRAVLDEAQEQGLRQFGKSFFTKELLPETLTEMGAEGLTTGLQNLIDGRPFFENMTETLVTSGIWGAGMSGSVGAFSLGARNFASTKQLGIITKSNKEITNYSKQINSLIDQKRRGVLSPSVNFQSEVNRLMDLIDQANNTKEDAINQVEVNIKKKGVREKRYLKDVSDSYGAAADIRQQASEIVSNVENGTMQKAEGDRQLDQLDQKYRAIMYHIDNFNSEGTFGDGYQAIAAKAAWSAPFSDARKELRQINNEALDLIRKEKRDPNYKPSKQELENKGSDIVKNREIDTQLAKDKKLSSKLGLGFKDIQNSNLANLYVNSEYNKKIQEAKDNNGKIKVGEFTFTVDELIDERNEIIDGFKSGEVSGINSKVLQTSIVVRDNMYKNNMTRTGLHETTHGIVDELIRKNPNSFNKLVNQVDHYLKYTGQTDVLNKMRLDNANLFNKDGSYNTKEFIASFMENVADGKIDLEKMDNQIAVLGLLFNSGLKDATNNAFDVSFSGETEILQYFTSLGKAFKSGTNPALLIKKLTDAVEVDQATERSNEPDQKGMVASKTKAANASLYERINTIYDSDESLDKRALKIGRAFENDIKSRLIKGYNLGKQFLQPSSWSGWDQEIQRDVISDTALGNSGVAGLVKSYANRDMSRFGNISLEAWINNRLNQRITGYLPKDLVRNELSIDEDVARQIEDAQAGRFDEAVTDTRKDDGPREIIPVEELKIITPELVDEVKDIITRTLKRTALTKGVSNETVLSDLNVAIEKEITKVIKSKMGPITRNVLGFAPKQYVDFIKDEMMTIVGSMPTNVIKQKAKSKAWAEIFKLTEIGREDIKKVNPDTGKVTNYRKQIFKLEKPDPQKFQRYFTRGGYTTLIERQKSLTRPMAQQLARSELARLRQDPNFIQDLAQRTGMTDVQVTEVFVDSVIQDIQAELDNTASEILQQDTVSFSKTLAEASSQDKQTFISGLRSDSFKSMLGQMLSNSEYFNKQGNTSALREAIITYFTGVKFDDLTPAKIKTIANDFGALQRPTFQRQISAEMKKFKAFDVADIVSEAFARRVEQQQDYNIIEADLDIFDVNFNKFDVNSINQARAMALKIAQKIGKQKFLRVFAPGMMGPAGLGGLNMIAEPTSIKITEADYDGFKEGNARAGIFKNRPDLERNVLNDPSVPDSTGDVGIVSNTGRYDSRVHKKDWYFSKKWEALDGDRSAQLEYIEEIAESGDDNKRIFRETVEILARDKVLTPTEARWFVATASEDMTGAIKNSASLIGFPDLNRKDLAESLNLKPNDKYVLEHMTPAKYMALLTYKYLLDPSAKNKSDFNTELDNFNTIILPEGVDTILRESGKQSSMGLQHKIGDSPFDTRYDEVLKIMKLVLRDGRVIGNTTSNFSKMNNRTATKNANVDLVNSSGVMSASRTQNNGITIIESEVLDKALSIARDPNAPVKKIRVFDFDDTLAQSKSKVFYEMTDGTKGELTAEQFAERGGELLGEGAVFDFSDFNIVRDGKPGPLLEVAKAIQKARGTEDVFVLTARAPESAQAIQSFLKSVGLDIPIENITGLGNSSEIAKSSWIVNKAAEGYNDFYFADDAPQNVAAVKRALDVIDVKSKVQQAKISFSRTVDQAMNDIIYQKTGIESFKEYSDVRAQAEGRGKRSFELIPPSAEDFGGLLYRMLSPGKVGDAQWEWMQENLVRPYNRGVNDLTVMQNQLAADFKALKQTLEGVPKNLKKKAFGGFTFEDVVRIHTWNKQGINIEGISKRDLKEVADFISQNPELDVFSDQLITITKGDGYYYPGPNWLAGTITTDFREGLRTTSRARFLKQWQDNVDAAFSPKNLNKIEAAFGTKYREALEDSLQRMKTGTNRSAKIGRLEAQFLDYINGSVGAVMFLNARSAVLQTISSLNFINWGDNNVIAAGRAFANQPQYWKDFMFLMNSDYLVDRRNGLKINVSENEIAEAAKTSKNKAKAVISTLLSKGFVLTQFADSFAIASGGATFYRNRIKKYVKEGMSESEASKKAFEDFKEISETSQQSADPSKISMQQASTIGKLILAWGNTPMQYNRIMKKATLDLVNGRGDWKDNISKILYYGALQNIIFTTLQSGLFAVLFNDDEEESDVLQEKGLKTANSLIDNLLRGMGIGGAIVSTIKNLGVEIYDRSKRKKPDYADVALKLLDVAPPIDVKVSKFRQGLTTYEYSQKDPRREEIFNLDNPSYMAAAKVIAATTNVPVDRLLQKMQNLRDAMDDQNEWWKRAALFLGWPLWQLRSTKEATEFKEIQKARRKEYKESKERKYAYREPLTEDQIKQQERAQDSISYVKLNKQEQVDKLDSLGLTKKEIRALRYEKDRVNKLLELMNE